MQYSINSKNQTWNSNLIKRSCKNDHDTFLEKHKYKQCNIKCNMKYNMKVNMKFNMQLNQIWFQLAASIVSCSRWKLTSVSTRPGCIQFDVKYQILNLSCLKFISCQFHTVPLFVTENVQVTQ